MHKIVQIADLKKMVSRIKIQPSSNRNPRHTRFKIYNRSLVSTISSGTTMNKTARHTQKDRFLKNCNLVQTNKQNAVRLKTAYQRQANKHPTSIKDEQNLKSRFKWFEPKTKKQLLANIFEDEETNIIFNSQNLQLILKRQKMKNQRNLLSYNILYLERKYNFSRFQLHTLYTMFHTLLTDSKGSIQKFKNGFEVILNMSKIAIRPQTLQKIFSEQEEIDFQNFIHMYSKIDQAIFKQNIIDYVQILFEGIYDKQKIRFDDIVRIMKNRITEKQSIDIAHIIYQQNDKQEHQYIKLSQIYAICHTCQSFAKKMYHLYTRQCKCD